MPTELSSWKKLQQHTLQKNTKVQPDVEKIIEHDVISLDFSGQFLTSEMYDDLLSLASESHLKEKIDALLKGDEVNTSEHRPALHTALRADSAKPLFVNDRNIMADVHEARMQMQEISTQIREGKWLGFTGKPITDVVNLGIGGSMLGPLFYVKAMADYQDTEVKLHFVSEIDPYALSRVCKKLNPETTLFIVSSKSFTTPETLSNLDKAYEWHGQPAQRSAHFIAVTANVSEAAKMGFSTILPIWDWVGGRYSFCSAINLIGCIAIGYQHFNEMLLGARSMDEHFKTRDFAENLPVMLGLLGILNINFRGINNHLVLTYAEPLEYFVPYLQQLDMESNGKSINKEGQPVSYDTGPIIWGGPGNQAQHSYYQHLCQGTRKITADLIRIKAYDGQGINKMCQGHSHVLNQGVQDADNPYSVIPGGIPVNNLALADCSPYSLGALIALYEHKIFVQGAIWNINSFDQPGVESAKVIFRRYS